MREERDMFASLGWEKEIKGLGYPHIIFNPVPKHDKGDENQYSDDYKFTPFLQSTQA
jgi:hypothetical protein